MVIRLTQTEDREELELSLILIMLKLRCVWRNNRILKYFPKYQSRIKAGNNSHKLCTYQW